MIRKPHAFRRWILPVVYARRIELRESGRHAVWDCKYDLMWTKKSRFPVQGGDVGVLYRELLREITRGKEMRTYEGSIDRDFVHVLIGMPP